MTIHQAGTIAIFLVLVGILALSVMGIGVFMADIVDTAAQALRGGS